MDEGLRPRDIQARIRAGQSSAQIAASSGMPLEKVERFEAPVLAERAHVADKARRTEVRHPGGSRALEDLVRTTLRQRGIDPESLDWDSWRRDDGRWTVVAEYGTEPDRRTASWTYDLVARAVFPEDESTRALTDPSAPPPPDERPHLASVPAAVGRDEVFDVEALEGDELETGTDATVTPLVREEPVLHVVEASTEVVEVVEVIEREVTIERTVTEIVTIEPDGEVVVEEFTDETVTETVAVEDVLVDDVVEETVVVEVVEETPPAPAPKPKSRSKRASVPSWDEILFGGPDDDLT